MDASNTVTALIQQTERRLAALRQIHEILNEFPDLAQELGIEAGDISTPASRNNQFASTLQRAVHDVFEGRRSNYMKIREFFLKNENEWTEAPRIGEALGMSRGTVATVLWTSHHDKFEQAPVAGSVKKKKWRLREEHYASAMSAGETARTGRRLLEMSEDAG